MSLFLRPRFVLPGGQVDSKNGTSFVHGVRFIQGNVEAYLTEDGIHGQLKQNEKKTDIHEKCISFQKKNCNQQKLLFIFSVFELIKYLFARLFVKPRSFWIPCNNP